MTYLRGGLASRFPSRRPRHGSASARLESRASLAGAVRAATPEPETGSGTTRPGRLRKRLTFTVHDTSRKLDRRRMRRWQHGLRFRSRAMHENLTFLNQRYEPNSTDRN